MFRRNATTVVQYGRHSFRLDVGRRPPVVPVVSVRKKVQRLLFVPRPLYHRQAEPATSDVLVETEF